MKTLKKPKGLSTGRSGSARLIKPTKIKAVAVPRGLGRMGGGRIAAEPSLTGTAGGGRGRRRKPGILGGL